MWGFILVVVYFGAALLAAAILLQPDRFVVTRSALIDAGAPEVFRHINELRNWQAWSPWAKLDPQAQTAYQGPEAGAGATFEWSGDKKAGSGRMKIIDSQPFEHVNIRLEMQKPFSAANDLRFELTPEAQERTKVTWTMLGRNTLISKTKNLFSNRDKVVGGQFEAGLANLNALCRK